MRITYDKDGLNELIHLAKTSLNDMECEYLACASIDYDNASLWKRIKSYFYLLPPSLLLFHRGENVQGINRNKLVTIRKAYHSANWIVKGIAPSITSNKIMTKVVLDREDAKDITRFIKYMENQNG